MTPKLDPVSRLIHQAIDRSDQGNYKAAIKLLTRAIHSDANNPQAYFERAMALLNLDRDTDVLADFDRCLELDPEFPGGRDWRSRALSTLGKHLGAAEDQLRLLREQPQGPYEGMGVSPQSWADCADSFAKAGDSRKAIELLEEYLSQHASHVTAYARDETAPLRILARLYLDDGNISRAIQLTEQSYASKYKCPADVLLLALALDAEGRYSEALEIVNKAIAINDQWQEALQLKTRLIARK